MTVILLCSQEILINVCLIFDKSTNKAKLSLVPRQFNDMCQLSIILRRIQCFATIFCWWLIINLKNRK